MFHISQSGLPQQDWRSAGRALLCLGMAAIEGFRLRPKKRFKGLRHQSISIHQPAPQKCHVLIRLGRRLSRDSCCLCPDAPPSGPRAQCLNGKRHGRLVWGCALENQTWLWHVHVHIHSFHVCLHSIFLQLLYTGMGRAIGRHRGMDGDGRVDGWVDERMDGWMDGWIDGWMAWHLCEWSTRQAGRQTTYIQRKNRSH